VSEVGVFGVCEEVFACGSAKYLELCVRADVF